MQSQMESAMEMLELATSVAVEGESEAKMSRRFQCVHGWRLQSSCHLQAQWMMSRSHQQHMIEVAARVAVKEEDEAAGMRRSSQCRCGSMLLPSCHLRVQWMMRRRCLQHNPRCRSMSAHQEHRAMLHYREATCRSKPARLVSMEAWCFRRARLEVKAQQCVDQKLHLRVACALLKGEMRRRASGATALNLPRQMMHLRVA